jgi:hypothetical protein
MSRLMAEDLNGDLKDNTGGLTVVSLQDTLKTFRHCLMMLRRFDQADQACPCTSW